MIRCAGPASDVAGFVLAGGLSRRMGSDKALVEFAGRPLIARALAILRSAGFSASVAGARSDLSGYAPVVADTEPDRGPLGGICSALSHARAEWSVFLPVDLPLLPAPLLGYMVEHARIKEDAVTVVSVSGFAQTFPAVIRYDALPSLIHELDSGRSGCFAAFQAAAAQAGGAIAVIPLEYVVQASRIAHPDSLFPAQWFANLNTPADLRRARAHRTGRIA